MKAQPQCASQVLLGIFIVGQLFFLVSANLIGFLKDYRAEIGPSTRQLAQAVAPGWPEEKGHLWQLLEHLAKTDKFWAQATGQLQTWSLFAPSIGRECVFPAVEYRWDDDPSSSAAAARPLSLFAAKHSWEAVCLGAMIHAGSKMPPAAELVLSANEPADPDHYFRVGNFRLRRYENNLVIALAIEGEELDKPEKTNERWSDKIRAHVADYAEIIHGYLRWRLDKDRARWPGREPPRQAILVLRRYHINAYEEAPPVWTGPHALPMARWQPAAAWDRGRQPVEWYDPETKRFQSLRK